MRKNKGENKIRRKLNERLTDKLEKFFNVTKHSFIANIFIIFSFIF